MTVRRRALFAAAVTIAATVTVAGPVAASDPLPVVSPTPQQISAAATDFRVPPVVVLATGDSTDAAAKDLLTTLLREHGVKRITAGGPGPVVRLGSAGKDVPEQAEGYALSVSRAGITIG